MICANCQKEIAAGSKFCYNCGAKQPETAVPAAAPSYGAPPKRLVRSTNDRKIAGVCAGVAVDKSEGVVKRHFFAAMLFSTA